MYFLSSALTCGKVANSKIFSTLENYVAISPMVQSAFTAKMPHNDWTLESSRLSDSSLHICAAHTIARDSLGAVNQSPILRRFASNPGLKSGFRKSLHGPSTAKSPLQHYDAAQNRIYRTKVRKNLATEQSNSQKVADGRACVLVGITSLTKSLCGFPVLSQSGSRLDVWAQ